MTNPIPAKKPAAFTLIEVLVVISIIGLLAAIIVPAAASAMRRARIKRAIAEMHQLETAIDRYKSAKGFYPPDNKNNPVVSPLFYELTGTLRTNGIFLRLHGNETMPQAVVTNVLGVGGFMNSASVSSATNLAEIREADVKNFWPSLETGKYGPYGTNDYGVMIFGLPMEGPEYLVMTNNTRMSPWHYISSNPTNNPDTYDLWIDIIISSPVPGSTQKTNRICNWSAQPIIL